MLAPTYGLVVGLVTDVDDPDQLGRIQLKFPWLPSDDTRSHWARIIRPMAGNDRGFFYQPEVDDEVMVAFEHGDFNHPLVLGFMHSNVDKPPNSDIDVHVRRLRSTAGHTFDLDDRDGKESVRLSTKAGHQLEMRDPEGFVEVVTAGGQKVRLQDDAAKIELSTKSGTKITMDDSPGQIELKTPTGVSVTISDSGGVSVSAPTGPVSVNSLTAEITSSASVTLKAPSMTLQGAMVNVDAAMAKFSGIVNCQMLIASSGVVSPSYTPGAGNIW